MSLSPLYSDARNDLHVSTPSDLHQAFAWLHPPQVKITVFRVYAYLLYLPSFNRSIKMGALLRRNRINSSQITDFAFTTLSSFYTLQLAGKYNSLVRVTRRAPQRRRSTFNHPRKVSECFAGRSTIRRSQPHQLDNRYQTKDKGFV